GWCPRLSNLAGTAKCPWRQGICPPAVARGRLRARPPDCPFLTPILALLAVVVAALLLALLLRRRRGGGRQRVVGELLDAADGLEARLREARAEIEAVAGSDENPVREAMQEMLRQRLWLQQHGGDASLDQLRSVRDSIEAARQRI